MRVEVNTVSEFCAELEADAQHVYEKFVRLRIDTTPEQDENITQVVGLWATALIRKESGDYVLEMGQSYGSERHSRDERHATSAAWEDWHKIEDCAKRHGLTIREGKWEIL